MIGDTNRNYTKNKINTLFAPLAPLAPPLPDPFSYSLTHFCIVSFFLLLLLLFSILIIVSIIFYNIVTQPLFHDCPWPLHFFSVFHKRPLLGSMDNR